MRTRIFTFIGPGLVILLAVFLLFLWGSPRDNSRIGNTPTGATSTDSLTALFSCDHGVRMSAVFWHGVPKSGGEGQPPLPNGSLTLTFSDGKTMRLAQTISADGGRYANTDESIVLWNKGRRLLWNENGKEIYTGCVEVAKDPGGFSQVVSSSTAGYSIRIPQEFGVDMNYVYPGSLEGAKLEGVRFVVPEEMTRGTNLAPDTSLSVETLPRTETCSARAFLADPSLEYEMVDNETPYLVASSTGAGAGNRYEETVYVLPGTDPCIGVRYFVHYGVFENYPAGTIREFNRRAIFAQFDMIRRLLKVVQ